MPHHLRALAPVWLLAAFLVVWLLTASARAAATPQGPIHLRERLNQAYALEQVSFPFSAMPGQCVAESIRVTGPGGPVPAQLTNIEPWPDAKGFVKSARLVFVVDELKPFTAATYSLAYGAKAAPSVASDLKVNVGKDQVEVTTSQGVGVRLPLGESKAGATTALQDVPAPLLAIRFGNGGWGGGSKMVGTAQVVAWASRLVEQGPVLARVVTSYALADGNTFSLTATVFAGDNTVRWDMAVKEDRPELAIDFRLPPITGVKQVVSLRGYGGWMHADRTSPLTPGDKPFTHLSPDTSIANAFQDCSWSVKLAADSGAELRLTTRNPSGWVDPPAPMTFGGFKAWQLEMIPKSWENWQRKRLPLTYSTDGTVAYRVTLAKGQRFWSVGSGPHRIGDRLDRVKDMVLDWTADAKRPSPRLFLSLADIQSAWKRAESDADLKALISSKADAGGIAQLLVVPPDQRKPEVVEAAVKPMRDFLSLLGNFDVLRSAIRTITMYDTVIDSGLISAQDRALFRAQAAYLGYQLADPQTWDMERGYHTGNPNMSVSYTLSLGVIACALSDHPMAKTWSDHASAWLDHWLTHEVGPNGEWMPEGAHYTIVSLEPMLSYALAARRAGFRDFTNDERFKKFVAYHAKTLTPRDPQRKGVRVTGAWGRGTSGDNLAIEGFGATIFAKSDPALSRHLQWVWAEGGYPIHIADSRFGGLEPYLVDRRLPAQCPNWSTDLFPNLGVWFRAAYGQPHESYAILLSHNDSLRNLDIWTPEIGGISQWFGRGKPLSTCFNTDVGYQERHELLRNGVRLARNWGEAGDPKLPFGYYSTTTPGAAAFLPQGDYVRTTIDYTKLDDRDWFPKIAPPAYPRVTPAREPKLGWTRQVLFLRDPQPAAASSPAYLVIRDTTAGGQSTAWQFWTLSEKLGTPEQAKDAAAFLADKPGPKLMPARELPGGARYTALGQHEMDVEYFVASPTGTPRHTLRYGGPDNSRVPEFQDLLHLQQPGDGAYYVAVFPRPRAEAPPTFAALAEGKLIKVAGAFGADYALLATQDTTAAAEGVTVKGTAAFVQQRGDVTTVSLGAPGMVTWNALGVAADAAASLRITPNDLTLVLAADFPGGDVTILAPKGAKVLEGGAKLTKADGGYRLSLGKGAARVMLRRPK